MDSNIFRHVHVKYIIRILSDRVNYDNGVFCYCELNHIISKTGILSIFIAKFLLYH